jgi:hypothetical protein
MIQIHEILDKYKWMEDTGNAELKKELLDLFGVSGSLDLLKKERDRLQNLRNTSTVDWISSKLNNQLHTVWITEQMIKGGSISQ